MPAYARPVIQPTAMTKHSQHNIEETKRTILLFGEVLVDCFPDNEVQGGAPFNVAHHLQRLGHDLGLTPMLVTRIGKDARGQRILDTLHRVGLPTAGVQQDSLHPTGEVRINLDPKSLTHQFDILPDQAWDYIHAQMAHLVGLLSRPQWLYFGTLAQRNPSHTLTRSHAHPALQSLLHTTQAHRFLDLNLRDPWVSEAVLRWSLNQAEVVKMNDQELVRIAHMLGLEAGAPQRIGARLIEAFELTQLIVTEGAQGAWYLDNEGRYCHTAAQPGVPDMVDTVGAGDGFAAVYLLGLMQGWDTPMTLQRAHQFAAEICRVRGAIPGSTGFYQRFIADWELNP